MSIFILPPTIVELEHRLRARGQDSQQAIDTRLAEAKTDISQAARYDYLVINDNFEQAHEDLLSVIRANRQDRARQMQRPEVAALINLE
jgi:guanylate kinase